MNIKKIQQNKGFTLIELLVVIAIIGLLSSVVLASLSQARMKARDARRIQDLKQMQNALELYKSDFGKYPNNDYNCASLDSCWNNGLLDEINRDEIRISRLPTDPVNNNRNPWTTGQYSYYYMGGIAGCDDGSCYDLIAQFEDTSNPLRCANRKYTYYSWIVNGQSWCGAGHNHSNYIYSPQN